MAIHFVTHEFLVGEGMSPDTDPREPVASIIVNQGTTLNVVVREVPNWVADNPRLGPFNLTWYTPGALIPATLREARENTENLDLRPSTNLFLFPGLVDRQQKQYWVQRQHDS